MTETETQLASFPFAIAIVHLVVGRLGRGDDAYAEHTPISLGTVEGQQLLCLMKDDGLRQSLEARFGVHFAFREPHGLAVARRKNHPQLQAFPKS